MSAYRDYEKNVRRAQRMAQLDAEVEREEKAELGEEEVVDVEVAPVQEEKPAEEPVKEEAQVEEEKPEEPAK